MKKRRVLSGIMAGVMTVSSSLVFQLPAGAAEDSQTVVDAQTVASWGALDVNLREYGKMASGTVVKITSRTTATDIRDTDEEGNEVTPQWAFGIVINNEWSHDIMPHCVYDSSKTEFVMELTAEQLQNNPHFVIQNQLPVDNEFTVEVSGLEEDTRSVVALPAVDRNISMNVYGGSWISGMTCGGAFEIIDDDIAGISYGSTTIGELRSSVRSFSTSANPYYSDTFGIGEDNLVYSVNIDYQDENGNISTINGPSIDYTSAGVTYVDESLEDDTLDDRVITGICLYVSAKTQWNGDIQNNEAVCEKLRSAIYGTKILLEISESNKNDVTVQPCSAKTVGMRRYTWDDGTAFAEGNVQLDLGELSGITLAQLVEQYHSVSVAAPGYYGNSAGVNADDIVYNLNMCFVNAETQERTWLDRDLTPLTEDCVLYTGNYCDMLSEAGDYVLESVEIRVSSKMEQTDDGTSQPVSELIRSMNDGDEFIVELVRDDRAAVQATSDMKSVSMEVNAPSWADGVIASTNTGYISVPSVDYGKTTIAQLKQDIKSISFTLPYYSDDIGAGSDAFNYNYIIRFADNSYYYAESDYQTLDRTIVLLTDSIDENSVSDQPVTGIVFDVGTITEPSGSDGELSQAISAVIRQQKEGNKFALQFAQDERTDAEVSVADYSAELSVWADDSWLDGSFAGGRINCTEVPGIEYGKTTFEQLRSMYKSISCTVPYISDTAGIGSGAFTLVLNLVFEDGSEYGFRDNGSLGSKFVQYLDEMEDGSRSNKVITDIYLSLEPKLEDAGNGKSRAVSEVIRSMQPGSKVTVTLREDDRRDVALQMDYPKTVIVNVYDDDIEYNDGPVAFVQLTADSDLVGMTVGEYLEMYRSLGVNCPGYFSDDLSVGSDGFNYSIGMRIVNGDSEDYIISETVPLDKEAAFTAYKSDYSDRLDYTISEIFVKISANEEQSEDGRTQETLNK